MPRAVVAVVGDGSVAGSVVGPILAELHLDDTRRHAEALSAAVDDVCARAHVALADLDGVGVGVGPGSFIGVRTGLSFALGLGRALGCRVVGIDGMMALAGSVDVDVSGPCLCVIDAKRGERYVGRVDVGPGMRLHAPGGPVALAPQHIDCSGAVAVVGALDGLQTPDGALALSLAGPTALGLQRALHAAGGETAASPVYVRGADAKVPLVDPAARRQAIVSDLDARGVFTDDDAHQAGSSDDKADAR